MTATTTAADRAEISRRNGRKGRGPTSPSGKTRSRMNALKHGMNARISVLPGEDEAAFRRQVDGFIEALEPRNAVELALAEQHPREAVVIAGRRDQPAAPTPSVGLAGGRLPERLVLDGEPRRRVG